MFHHPSGESIVGCTTIPDCDMKGMNKYQSVGAGLTYFRRYALSSMLGIITDSDTEVVLEMYKRYGEKALDYFVGMFSFVIYNEKL